MLPPLDDEKHRCTLSANSLSPFQCLHPNAGIVQKLRRFLYKMHFLDMDGRKRKYYNIHESSARTNLRNHIKGPFHYIIHPFSKLKTFIDGVFFIILIFRYISEPLILMKKNSFWIYRIIRELIYLLIMTSFFFTGYISSKDIVVLNPRRIRKKYVTTYFFFDLITVLECCLNIQYLPMRVVTVLLFLLIILLRLWSIWYVVEFAIMSCRLSRGFIFILTYLLWFALIFHSMIFVIYWIPSGIYIHNNHFPNNSWIITEEIDTTTFNIHAYVTSLLIAVCYFFGSSYLDNVKQPSEQLIFSFVAIFGRIYTLLMLAKILAFFGVSDISECNYENQLLQLRNYMRNWNVSTRKETKILETVEFKCQKKYFNEMELNATIPKQLRNELFLHYARNLVNKNAILKIIPKAQLGKIFANMKNDIYFPQDIIMTSNDRAYLHFVLSGTVACYNQNGTEFYHIEDGDIFGVLAASLKCRKSYPHYVVAAEMTEIFSIRYKLFQSIFQNQPDVAKYFEKILKERVAKYVETKNYHKYKKDSIIVQLSTGELLEKPRIRHVVSD